MIPAVLLNDTSFNNHHGCNKVVTNINLFFSECNIKILYGNPLGTNWRANEHFMRNLRKAKVLIINGEGTIHHNRERGLLLLEAIPIARKLGLKVFLINMTYQENPKSYEKYLQQADLITVRESLSQKELQKANLKALLVPDFTFFHFSNPAQSGVTQKTLITDSVHHELSQQLKKLTSELPDTEFFPIWVRNPNELFWSRFSTKFIKLPSKMTLKRLFSNPKELISVYRMNSALYAHTVEKHKDFIGKIKNSNAIICARFHSLCMAIQQQRKFIAIKSNTFKMESLIYDIGLSPKRVVKMDDIQHSIEIPDFSKEEKDNIERYLLFSAKQFTKMKEMVNEQMATL